MRNILRFRLVAILMVAVGLFAGGSAVSAQDDGTPVPGCSTAVFSVFYSENVDAPVATISDPIVTAGGETDASAWPAAGIELEIYAGGDLTSDPVETLVTNDGGTAVSGCLAVGDYVVLETSTNNFFPFTIADGVSTTTITILLPVADGTPVPADDAAADDDGAADDGEVSKLPNTGQGSEDNNGSTIVLLLGSMSAVALAAGFAWRQRRA